ncbi:DUF1062 domain-containing protein [Lachnospiraceae bacterium HCP1S3_A10]
MLFRKRVYKGLFAIQERRWRIMKNNINCIKVYHRCGGCGKKQEFINSGKFRVNANGNKVDVWLIYRCRKCKHSWNMVIYERVRPQKIPRKLYDLFLCNDEDTACMYGNDISFLRRNNAEIKR